MKHIAILLTINALFACSANDAAEHVASLKFESAKLSVPVMAMEPPPAVQYQKLIRRAVLSVEVRDLHKTYDSIKLLTSTAQGYVANEDHSETDTRTTQNMEMRIPEQQFDIFLVNLEGLSQKLLSRDITTQDVTAEIEDLAVRLKTKKALENQYNEILRQAKTVKDMLAIEEQLGTVREEIESMEARKRFMDKQIAYSVIDLSMFQITAPEPGYNDRLANALLEGWRGLTDMIFGIIASWPLLILLAPFAWGIRSLYRRLTRGTVTAPVQL
jgi:hypothetical protein